MDVCKQGPILNENFQYRGLNDPKVFFNDNIRGLLTNYRAGYLRMAEYYRQNNDHERMLAALDSMGGSKAPEHMTRKDNELYELLVATLKSFRENVEPPIIPERQKTMPKGNG